MIFEDSLLSEEIGIKELAPEIKSADESQGIKVTADEIVDRNNSEWLYMKGELTQGTPKTQVNPVESFVTMKGKQMIRLSIVADKSILSDAGEILRQVVDTLEIRE